MDTLQLPYTILDVFTDTIFAGNPLAVVRVPVGARARLTAESKQRIAREFNLSETVFLHCEEDSSAPSREIDIFTTTDELPFAGHPTIGTACLVRSVLRWHHVETLLTKAGPIKIAAVEDGSEKMRAQIPHDVHVHRMTLGSLLEGGAPGTDVKSVVRAGLSDDVTIREAELSAPVVSIVKGMTFLLIKLPSLEHLARVNTRNRLELEAISSLLLDGGPWGKGFVSRYYYVPQQLQSDTDADTYKVRTRMIEPGFEDPATGSAACTLASYLTLSDESTGTADGPKVHKFDIIQGVEIGRRSDISVEVFSEAGAGDAGTQIERVFLGGTAVVVMNGTLNL